ncbi:MAG: ATP-binding cassette domain-containing protein [Alphaproteobacteria bacterium]|jgi:lipoprotein-releasing system ATP-binding protein|nr:ATP-binding cassette domain-containing protein [Alphaproteobacteria bacterium]
MSEAPARDTAGPPADAGAAPAGALLSLEGVTRGFDQGGGQGRLDVLTGADLRLVPGEMVALVGPSGAGKSTLLQIAGLLERPDAGRVVVDGTDCTRLGDAERTAMRRTKVGFVYQFHHLLPEFTARENVVVPQMIDGVAKRDARARADTLLGMVGLAGRVRHRPGQLSGGEQQRVAIARALANDPRILLADEPTGNLDHKTADDVFDLLLGLIRDTGIAALIATHNLELAARMDRVLEMKDGRLTPHR